MYWYYVTWGDVQGRRWAAHSIGGVYLCANETGPVQRIHGIVSEYFRWVRRRFLELRPFRRDVTRGAVVLPADPCPAYSLIADEELPVFDLLNVAHLV